MNANPIVTIAGPLGQSLTADFQNEAANWYQLPQQMIDRLATHTSNTNDTAPLPAEEFKRVRAAVAQYAANSVAEFEPAYHNIDHFEKHAKSSIMLFDACVSGGSKDARLAMRQLIELAGLLHDVYHPCSTLRVDSPKERWHKPELGAHVTCEFVSALAAAELFESLGLGLMWQLGVTYLIWATTFGHGDAVERGFHFVPKVLTPAHPLLSIMRLADVWSTDDAKDDLKGGVRVNALETGAKGTRITDPMEVIAGQRGFEDYRQLMITHLMEQVTRGKNLLEQGMRQSRQRQHEYSQAVDDLRPDLVNFTTRYLQERSG